MAKSEGKQFEDDIKASCENAGMYIERFKDNPMFGQGQGRRVIASKNPADYIAYQFPYMYLLELKSTKGTSFSFSEKIIKQNQIDKLLESQNYYGVIAGFLFNFRERETKKGTTENKVYFVAIRDFVAFKDSSSSKSINEEMCSILGFEVKSTRKVIHYKYDIEEFLLRCQSRNEIGREIMVSNMEFGEVVNE